MGRWAQRRVRGGGPPAPVTGLLRIVSGEFLDEGACNLTYNGPIDATSLNAGDFHDTDNITDGFSLTQVSPTVIRLEWFDGVTAINDLCNYDGSATGVESPQLFTIN
jgi:hypothetical protein